MGAKSAFPHGSVELIRLAGEGNSVVLRITGRETREARPGARPTDVLTGAFVVETPFVGGTLNGWVFPTDLTEWQDCLDALDAGESITWRDSTRAPALSIERDDTEQRLRVTISDNSMTLTAVTVTVPLTDAWFDDAYDRLDQVWKTWPPTERHPQHDPVSEV